VRAIVRSRRLPAALAATTLAGLGASSPAVSSAQVMRAAAASHVTPMRPAAPYPFVRPQLPAGQRYACPAPTRAGQMTCMSIVQTMPRPAGQAGAAAFRGYGPSDLRKAYGLMTAAARRGRGVTVAIVDGFNDPRAAVDLAHYRRLFHLPPCGVASGCLRIVNENGGSRLPIPDRDWATEESLDLDMVSAICPRCHILLVEAKFPDVVDLGIAVDTAVRMGARYVSNSYGGPEIGGQDAFSQYFNHPGAAIGFAAGDFGYALGFPADLPYVTAVGGTSLKRTSGGRGFTESVWGSATGPYGTGSGCSAIEPKPSWQRVDATEPAGCLNRTMNDVAAVADPQTGVAVIDTYLRPGRMILGGTSVSAPIVTSVYALAGRPTPATYPAEYPYLHASHLFPVTSGVNGQCEPNRQYLCSGEPGYDAPTGLGTPDGIAAFTDHGRHRVTLIDPGTADAAPGQSITLRIKGLDTRTVSALHYRATGLPAGLSIHSMPHSADATITGTLPAAPATFHVTVTARDGTATGRTHFMIVTVPSLTTPTATPGQISKLTRAHFGVRCMDDSGGGVGTIVRIQACDSSGGQQWLYASDGRPDAAGALTIGGLCLTMSSVLNKGVLATCDGSNRQQWQFLDNSQFGNLATGKCLAGGGSGSAVTVNYCTAASIWQLPQVQIASGAGQLCMTSSGTLRTAVTVTSCANSSGQQWTPTLYDDFIAPSGLCLTPEGTLTGSSVVIATCHYGFRRVAQQWMPLRGGQLMNIAALRCLADPGAGGSGTALTLQDCYGEPGEVWGVN
jgi:hypothetical protein